MGMASRSKDKLSKEIESEVTTMFESILDYAQIACSTPETFKALRSKVLRVGNNCIRTLKGKLDNYDVDYQATSIDIIEVNKK